MHDIYQSPFTWRYGSHEMRRLFSEEHRRRLWRRVWVALARAQAQLGLIPWDAVRELEAHVNDVNLARAWAIEREIHHDVMAEIRVYAEQCPQGARVLHLGATSTDIVDNADVLRQKEALRLILRKLSALLLTLSQQVEQYAAFPIMGFTHLQPAEPTTLGYRLAQTLQDLWMDAQELLALYQNLKGKGFKGAVGTLASFQHLLEPLGASASEMERLALQELGLEAFPVSTQTYPRKQDWRVLSALAGLAQSLYRFAFDLRILQSPGFGEWAEPFSEKQVGSSAMPFKRNPVRAEKMDSLARYVAALPQVAWNNAAHSLLERTLDDSANRRVIIPQAFLAVDELLETAQFILSRWSLDMRRMEENLRRYAPFAALERVLIEAVARGADRQTLHEVLRMLSMKAWGPLQQGAPNPLPDMLKSSEEIRKYLSPDAIERLMDVHRHIGEAPQRARALAQDVTCWVKTHLAPLEENRD